MPQKPPSMPKQKQFEAYWILHAERMLTILQDKLIAAGVDTGRWRNSKEWSGWFVADWLQKKGWPSNEIKRYEVGDETVLDQYIAETYSRREG